MHGRSDDHVVSYLGATLPRGVIPVTKSNNTLPTNVYHPGQVNVTTVKGCPRISNPLFLKPLFVLGFASRHFMYVLH